MKKLTLWAIYGTVAAVPVTIAAAWLLPLSAALISLGWQAAFVIFAMAVLRAGKASS